MKLNSQQNFVHSCLVLKYNLQFLLAVNKCLKGSYCIGLFNMDNGNGISELFNFILYSYYKNLSKSVFLEREFHLTTQQAFKFGFKGWNLSFLVEIESEDNSSSK